MNEHKQWEREMSKEFSGMMDGIRTEPVLEDSLLRSLQAAEEIVMTQAARERGQKNAFICLIVLWPVCFLIAQVINWAFDVGFTLALGGVFGSVFAICFPVFLVSMILDRARAGKVLMDCGPFPARKMHWISAAVTFVGGVAVLITSTGTLAVCAAVFLFAFSSYFLVTSMGRLQICENGVFTYWGLLPWGKIKSYRWEGESDATLMVQTKSRFSFTGHGAIPIAVEQKKAVDALLQAHLE